MTIDLSAPNGATETPAHEPRRESGGPALKTRDRAQYEAVLALQAKLAPTAFLKNFAPRVIDAGLAALARKDGDGGDMRPELDAAREELRALRKVAAEAKTMVTMVNDQAAEIDRLRARVPTAEAHAHLTAAANMGRDDMIRTALAGVEAHARKGDSARNALEALEAIRVAIGAPDLATAIADAAKYREARLVTLKTQRENGPANPRKGKASDDSEAT